MHQLFKVPQDQRDKKWEEQFLSVLPEAQIKLIQDSPIQGPDGMPYLPVVWAEEGEPLVKVLRWLADRGIGMVFVSEQKAPDYVLTYGMIWNYLNSGEFLSKTASDKESKEEIQIQPGQQLFAGVPSEEYFPDSYRKIFKNFLLDQGVTNPKMIMLSVDNETFDLCFSWESLGQPPQAEWQGILQGFSWFFPMHYSFSIMSEKHLQGTEFVAI